MDLNNVGKMSAVLGNGLNKEEESGLEVAMLLRKLQEKLDNGPMLFWGKINGATQDYYIVVYVDRFAEFPDKKFYFCPSSDFTLRACPTNDEEYIKLAEKITSPFVGDPSFFSYNGEDPDAEPEDPDAPPVERFREMNRLTYVVNKIDRECALVPRGALSLDSGKKVILNSNFQGLSYDTSLQARAYMHLRRPEGLQSIALLKRTGILKTDDFLDCIDKDTPKEMWVIAHDNGAAVSFVRNLYWEGYGFYAVLKSNEFGGAYFGTGVPNYDIAFML